MYCCLLSYVSNTIPDRQRVVSFLSCVHHTGGITPKMHDTKQGRQYPRKTPHGRNTTQHMLYKVDLFGFVIHTVLFFLFLSRERKRWEGEVRGQGALTSQLPNPTGQRFIKLGLAFHLLRSAENASHARTCALSSVLR